MIFKEDGTLKILQLTDIHYTDGRPEDRQTVEVIKKLIETEMPDLIVLTGDTVYGDKNISVVPDSFGFIDGYNIPWTFVFGNHDDEDIGNKAELFKVVEKLPNCLAYDDVSAGAGVGNHVIDIKDKKGDIVWRLMLIDSGNYINGISGDYDYIKESQIKWYEEKVNENVKGAIAFFHIPLPEYDNVWAGKHIGEKNEDICPSRINSGFADRMVSDGITRAVFVGHDHINDYIGVYKNVLLGYGRAAGYNTYGMDGFKKGGRIILLNENDPVNFDTWVQLEDGTLINSFNTSQLRS